MDRQILSEDNASFAYKGIHPAMPKSTKAAPKHSNERATIPVAGDTSEFDTQSGHGPYDRGTIGPKLQGKPALFEGKVLIVHLHVCHTFCHA